MVVRHEVHYRAPLTYRFQPVSIECWVTDIRAASFTMAYEVFHEEPDEADGRASTCAPPPCSRRSSSSPSARGGSATASGRR